MSYPNIPNKDPSGGSILSGVLLLFGVLGMMAMGLCDIWF
jgi:hypothetical protein